MTRAEPTDTADARRPLGAGAARQLVASLALLGLSVDRSGAGRRGWALMAWPIGGLGALALLWGLWWRGASGATLAWAGLCCGSLGALAWALHHMRVARSAVHRMSGIVAGVAAPVLLLDRAGRALWLNEAARGAIDRPMAACLQQHALGLLGIGGGEGDGGAASAAEALGRAMAEGRPFQGEVACRSTQGRSYWWAVDLQVLHGPAGEPSGWLLMGSDITERLHATWQLQRVLDGTRAGTWEMNVLTQAARVNAHWRQRLGYDLDQAGLDTIAGVGGKIHPDDRPEANRVLGEHLRGERPFFEVEQRLQHRDGHWVWMLSRGMVVTRDRQGHAEWLAGTHLDISERVAHAEELQRAKLAAEAANQAKSAFLATMSHEIRTPMNGIIGLAEILSHERLPEEQADAVNTIVESGRALLAIIDDILDFSKIEAGRVDLERIAVPLRPLAEGVCDPLAAQVANQAVTLRLFVSPALPTALWGDPTRLRQVLFNLVGNALKFCRVPGRRGEVAVRLTPADAGHWQIEVADNGIGMAPATLASLFTAFTQAEASTTRRFGGTGLGLAITRRLVELMAGDIQVRSAPGEGSTFTLRLPLQPADTEAGGPAVPDLAGVHSLTLCANATEHAVLADYLRLGGAQVQAAEGLADAARRAARLPGPVVVVHDQAELPSQSQLDQAFAGLADVRHLLVAHGRRSPARIVAQNTARMGALRLGPLLRGVALVAGRASPEAVSLLAEPAWPARAAGQQPAILVAEDDRINQKVITRQLALLGYEATVAHNGLEALECWRTGRFGLLLTDLHMPEMDGYALARQLRAEEPPGQRRPLLALTANALKGEAARALEAGLDDCLSKPIAMAALQAALLRWLPVAADPATAASPVALTPPPTAPAPQPAITSPLLDLAVLSAMLGDDPPVLRQFLADYRLATVQAADEMAQALAGGQLTAVAQTAHKLKSSSRAFGALALGDHCADLERQGLAQDRAAVGRHWADFQQVLAQTQARIDHVLEAPA